MRVAVIIPTLGRPGVIQNLLAHLEKQTVAPDEVIVSAPCIKHVGSYVSKNYRLKYVYGPMGLCAQRNRALSVAIPDADIVVFFDDDFVPSHDYISTLIETFQDEKTVAMMTGRVVADGIEGPGFTYEDAIAIIGRETLPRSTVVADDPVGVYGCNMAVRTAMIGAKRFDEHLPLYGWQEDIDFSYQFHKEGRVVRHYGLLGVHLGIKSGRSSGVRFGYSQVINPIYLLKKGTMPTRFALKLIARNMVANLIKSFRPEPWVDRRGRLRGNFLAICHMARGSIDPEKILLL